ncbi:hypothetical protein MRX96_010079 [Rhipicephalus microplus]
MLAQKALMHARPRGYALQIRHELTRAARFARKTARQPRKRRLRCFRRSPECAREKEQESGTTDACHAAGCDCGQGRREREREIVQERIRGSPRRDPNSGQHTPRYYTTFIGVVPSPVHRFQEHQSASSSATVVIHPWSVYVQKSTIQKQSILFEKKKCN